MEQDNAGGLSPAIGGLRRARSLLRKRAGDERMAHIHLLMDFEGAEDGGDVEDAGPPTAAE